MDKNPGYYKKHEPPFAPWMIAGIEKKKKTMQIKRESELHMHGIILFGRLSRKP